MKELSKIDGLILLAVNFAGCIYGRTYLQKLFFLIENELLQDIDLNYIKYYYGPFSRDLRDHMDNLIEQGLIKESVTLSNGHEGHCYELTAKGKTAVENLQKNQDMKSTDNLKEFCAKYQKYSPCELLRLVYSKYPEWTINSVLN